MEKAYKGMGMEGSVAVRYEKTTRRDMEEYRRLAQRFAAGFPEGADVLEVAPGPGFLSVEMAKSGRLHVTGLDISKTFVQIARKNAEEVGVRANFVNGNASQMPFADESFDFVVCRAAFKNFTDPVGALREMRRVLRPGCRGVVIDLRGGVKLAEVKKYVDTLQLPFFQRMVEMLIFRFMLMRRAYQPEQMEAMLRQVPFAHTEVTTNSIGMEAWFER
ncbi:MAG TPA: class I SAM-dependent methyltransferase [Acidobacteriaceae bacterium]|jgi:ubiquinone/menaquinone biosynthesis C-methylase UbiE|nr:class I SAM-dependent methyltransferase [Acidobacteriaceae bacterium]